MANVDTRGGVGADVEASVLESTAASAHTDPWEAQVQQLLAHEWAKVSQLPPLEVKLGGNATGDSVRRVKSMARLNRFTRHHAEHNVDRCASVTTHDRRPARIRWSSIPRDATPLRFPIMAGPVPGAARTAPPGVPKPTRPCPKVMFEAHEVHPDDDKDWTIPPDSNDWSEEWRLREERNVMIMNKLKAGKTVQYRSSGSSLYPIVKSGDLCIFHPVTNHDSLKKGDVVFCFVRPSRLYYAHKIFSIEWWNSDWWDWEYSSESDARIERGGYRRFVISSNRDPPKINGFCRDDDIYGILVQVNA